MSLELVLPCYNESKSLQTLIRRGKEAAEQAGLTSQDFRLMLVENGSKDNSREVLAELEQNSDLKPWFQVVPVDQNKGYGFGIWSGLLKTKAEFIGWSHADQQCDPKDAIEAYQRITKLSPDQQKKVLYKGCREGRSFKEIFVSRVFDLFSWALIGFRFYEINAQPKIFHRELLNDLKNPPNDFSFDLYVLYCARKKGLRFELLTVQFPPRIHGLSNWASNFASRYKTILRMIRYMYDLGRTEGRIS